MNEKETATILAALRYWQEETQMSQRKNHDHFESMVPLDDDEIDELCERLNSKDPDGLIDRGVWGMDKPCCRDHDLQANDGLEFCLCCGDEL